MTKLEELKELIGFMRENRVSRIKIEAAEIELHPLAFALPSSAGPSAPEPAIGQDPDAMDHEDTCKCGHSYALKHSEAGCLEGCAPTACSGEGA